MKAFPHTYPVDASVESTGPVTISSRDLPQLASAPPAEFGGPGDQWSPETLLVAAAADCYVLTFRAVARAGKLEWEHLDCHAEGTLDRVDGKNQFIHLVIHANLTIKDEAAVAHATALLHKAEHVCLISNSLKAETRLRAAVTVL